MAKKFEILESALVITDTVTGEYRDFPKRDVWYSSKDLIDGKIKMYDTNGINSKGSYVYQCDLSDSIDSKGAPFTKTDFASFVYLNMGFNTASGGSEVQTMSWGVSGSDIAVNTLLKHNGIADTQIGVPIIYDSYIKKIAYTSGGTRKDGAYTFANWGIDIIIQGFNGNNIVHTLFLSGEAKAKTLTLATPILLDAGDELRVKAIKGDGADITSISFPIIEISTDKNTY